MTTPAQARAQRQRNWSAAYRRANLAKEARRARRWHKAHPNYVGKYLAALRGPSRQCSYVVRGYHTEPWCYCRNLTRHESGLCWRHRAQALPVVLDDSIVFLKP